MYACICGTFNGQTKGFDKGLPPQSYMGDGQDTPTAWTASVWMMTLTMMMMMMVIVNDVDNVGDGGDRLYDAFYFGVHKHANILGKVCPFRPQQR